MDLRQFTALKEKVNKLQQDKNKAEGALEQLYIQLKEFGCKDKKEAQKLVDKLAKEKEKKEAELTPALAEFEKECGGKLNG